MQVMVCASYMQNCCTRANADVLKLYVRSAFVCYGFPVCCIWLYQSREKPVRDSILASRVLHSHNLTFLDRTLRLRHGCRIRNKWGSALPGSKG